MLKNEIRGGLGIPPDWATMRGQAKKKTNVFADAEKRVFRREKRIVQHPLIRFPSVWLNDIGAAPLFGRPHFIATHCLPDSRFNSKPFQYFVQTWIAADGGVQAPQGFFWLLRNSTHFAKRQNCINGIENFWNCAKRHLRQFNGISKGHFKPYSRECGWRFQCFQCFQRDKIQISILKQSAKQDLFQLSETTGGCTACTPHTFSTHSSRSETWGLSSYSSA